MSQKVFVHFLPKLMNPETLRGGAAVVIDVLRASTTIIHALAAGATAVIPCEEVDQARQLAANLPAGSCLSGGEREGVRIDGFDLDNSPLAYTAEAVSGKTILFTTTNGTRAIAKSTLADFIIIGSFVNLQAVTEVLSTQQRAVHLVCAGTDGAVTMEDVLFAGAVTTALQERHFEATSDETRIAARLYHSHRHSDESLFDALCDSVGGRNLLARGFEADIQRAAEINRVSAVPQYIHQENRITLSV